MCAVHYIALYYSKKGFFLCLDDEDTHDERTMIEREVVSEELDRFLQGVKQCDCGADVEEGLDVVEEGGTSKFKLYDERGMERDGMHHVKLGDGIGDKYDLYAYRMGESYMICLTQESGDTSMYCTGCQYLYMKPIQWKTFELALPALKAMLRRASRDPDYNVNGYHVVGRIHANIEHSEGGGRSLLLYQGFLDEHTQTVRRNVFCCVALDMIVLDKLTEQFPIVDAKFPAIQKITPCYMQRNHYSSFDRALSCEECNPF